MDPDGSDLPARNRRRWINWVTIASFAVIGIVMIAVTWKNLDLADKLASVAGVFVGIASLAMAILSTGQTNGRLKRRSPVWQLGITRVGDPVTINGTERAVIPDGFTAWSITWEQWIQDQP